MTTPEIVQRLLVDAAGEALCDSCLAFACSTTLFEMRRVTEQMLSGARFQRTATCASCRRPVPAIVYSAKCAQCSRPVLPGEDALEIGGDFLHAPCFLILTSAAKIRMSRKLKAESRRLIEDARRQMAAQRTRDRSRDC